MGMTNAERQRRYRDRRAAGEAVRTFQCPKDRRSRPQRWADAVDQLRELNELTAAAERREDLDHSREERR